MFHYSFYKCPECGMVTKVKSTYEEKELSEECWMCEVKLEKTPVEHYDIAWLIEYGVERGWTGYNKSNKIESEFVDLKDYN